MYVLQQVLMPHPQNSAISLFSPNTIKGYYQWRTKYIWFSKAQRFRKLRLNQTHLQWLQIVLNCWVKFFGSIFNSLLKAENIMLENIEINQRIYSELTAKSTVPSTLREILLMIFLEQINSQNLLSECNGLESIWGLWNVTIFLSAFVSHEIMDSAPSSYTISYCK